MFKFSKYKNFSNIKFSRTGYIFILLALVLGFADIIKFPMVVAKYGPAIIIVFVIGLILVGLPIFIFEMSIGKKFHKSGVKIFQILKRKNEIFGWVQVAICLIILIYYSIILCWALVFFIQLWIPNFIHEVNIEKTVFNLNAPEYNKYFFGVIIFLLWLFIAIILSKNFHKYLSKLSIFTTFSLIILTIIFVVYLFTLKNSYIGIDYLFHIDLNSFGKIGIWTSGFGQVFLTIAVGTGIIFTCSKYSNSTQEINNTAVIIILVDLVFIILSILIGFSILGNEFAHQSSIDDFKSWLGFHFGGYINITSSFTYLIQFFNYLPVTLGYGINLICVLVFLIIIISGFTSLLILLFTIKDNFLEKSNKFNTIKFYGIFSLIFFSIILFWIYLLPQYTINVFEYCLTNNILLLFLIIECLLISKFQIANVISIYNYSNKRSLYKIPYMPASYMIMIIIPALLSFFWGYDAIISTIHLFSSPQYSYQYKVSIIYFFISIVIFILISIITGLVLKYLYYYRKNKPFRPKYIFAVLPIILLAIFVLWLVDINVYNEAGNILTRCYSLFVIIITIVIFPIILINLEDKTLKWRQITSKYLD